MSFRDNVLDVLPEYVKHILSRLPVVDDVMYEGIVKNLIGQDVLYDAIKQYKGGDGFLNNVSARARAGGGLSPKQYRALVNKFRARVVGNEEDDRTHPKSILVGDETEHSVLSPDSEGRMKGEVGTFPAPAATFTPPAPEELHHRCYTCGEHFASVRDVMSHKEAVHGRTGLVGEATATVEPAPRGAVSFEPKHHLDLSVVPDGRFALYEPGKTEPTFILITTVKRPYWRRGKYRWGMTTHRNVRIEAGRREVRIQRGDTKELVGEQHPSTRIYHGEHEDAVKQMMDNPEVALVLYGVLIGKCCYCGRSLTDEESRLRGIGPDCYVEKHLPRYGVKGVTR